LNKRHYMRFLTPRPKSLFVKDGRKIRGDCSILFWTTRTCAQEHRGAMCCVTVAVPSVAANVANASQLNRFLGPFEQIHSAINRLRRSKSLPIWSASGRDSLLVILRIVAQRLRGRTLRARAPIRRYFLLAEY
jgi:hypothetical protein